MGNIFDNRISNGRKCKIIDESFKTIFEDEVKACLRKGIRLTANDFKDVLKDHGIEASKQTILNVLNIWGLKWGRLHARDIRRQTQGILEWKIQYLKFLEENDQLPADQQLERVYIDESYINANHCYMKGWHFPSSQGKYIYRPSGRGRRIVMVEAITKDGWLGTSQNKIVGLLGKE